MDGLFFMHSSMRSHLNMQKEIKLKRMRIQICEEQIQKSFLGSRLVHKLSSLLDPLELKNFYASSSQILGLVGQARPGKQVYVGSRLHGLKPHLGPARLEFFKFFFFLYYLFMFDIFVDLLDNCWPQFFFIFLALFIYV